MKKLHFIYISIFILILSVIMFPANVHSEGLVFADDIKNTTKSPMLAIVIDDFGGFDRSGISSMLEINAPLTCAIMPNLDYSIEDMNSATQVNKEVIVHMPMQSHVSLPESWYGPVYIKNTDSPETAINKLERCINTLPEAKGFNIHIGSGVCQNSELMKAIMKYAKDNNLIFLDSRTHLKTICDKVAKEINIVYLGRDEFLEPDHNKSYENVKKHLLIGRDLALEKGYAIVIGHVGAHGGENTAKAISDSIKEIESSGVKLVTLSELHSFLQNS